MNKKMSKRQRDIKTKLMAAICMLLVSSIMMVSTTYAWFTLSTAPEVTGINTAVGANGNLEMALLPEDAIDATSLQPKDDNFGITSNSGDSMTVKDATLANVTWGNLVDLSHSNYGMDKLVLYPAKLNAATSDALGNPTALAEAMLATPAYGPDGRVSELKNDTVTSTMDINTGKFPQNSNYGVRAVGTASGMTDRQLAYRDARGTASTAMVQARTFASQSLNNNGAALANIAISHFADTTKTYTQEEIAPLKLIVTDLLGNGDTKGVLNYLEDAYLNYIVAYAASAANSAMDDTAFSVFETNLRAQTDIYAAMTWLGEQGVAVPDVSDYVGYLKATRETVTTAQSELNALSGDSITWEQLRIPLDRLAKTDAMAVNDIPVKDVKDRIGDLAASIGSGLRVVMSSNGGVYADIADHAGDFTAKIKLKNISAAGVTIEEMDAFMDTKTTVSPDVYLGQVGTVVANAKAPSNGEGGQTMPISDMFGYVIDLAFRTNAAASDLLLQTEAVDRIYDDNAADAETMGHGSTMTFTTTAPEFTVERMKGLMECIRIVFFDPTTNNVMATAKLDMTSATNGTDGMSATAPIYLYKMASSVTTYEEVPSGETGATHVAFTNYREAVTGENPEFIEDPDNEGQYIKAAEGTPATHIAFTDYREATDDETATHKAVTTGGGAQKLIGTDAVITALTQNTAKAVSALVYLDGENVGNDDVAATAATSMTGTMNLQFASSANLTPMNYTPLMSQGSTTETTEAVTP